jgi:hypothetical protein
MQKDKLHAKGQTTGSRTGRAQTHKIHEGPCLVTAGPRKRDKQGTNTPTAAGDMLASAETRPAAGQQTC